MTYLYQKRKDGTLIAACPLQCQCGGLSMEVKESKRTDQYRTFRAKVKISAQNPMSGHGNLIWTKSLFYRSWESCAVIAAIGCTLEQTPKLFPSLGELDILSIQVDMLNSANDPRAPLYIGIFQWVQEIEKDKNAIKVKLSDLLSLERRQIRDLEFLRVA